MRFQSVPACCEDQTLDRISNVFERWNGRGISLFQGVIQGT